MRNFIEARYVVPRVAITALAASALSACSTLGGIGVALGPDETCRPAPAAHATPQGDDCLMRQRQAYEQALGQLSVQVLR